MYLYNDAVRRPVTVITGLTALATIALSVIGGLAYFQVVGGSLGALSHITQLAMLGGGAVAAVALISFTVIQLQKQQPTAKIGETTATANGVERTTYTVSMDDFNTQSFKSWLYAQNPPQNKQIVFQNTLEKELDKFCKALQGTKTVARTWIESVVVDFSDQLTRKIDQNPLAQGMGSRVFYDFTHEDRVYVDFANANVFGGSWRSSGFVQEEILFVEFFELALLAYLTDRAGYMIHPTCKGGESADNEMTGGFHDMSLRQKPFFVPAIRSYEVNGGLYGRGLNEAIIRASDFIESPEKYVYIAGIAARNWRKYPGECKYTKRDLELHLEALYGVCLEAREKNQDDPEINSGQWGCGVFGGNILVITALHLLAGKMTGVRVNMYDMDDAFVQNVKNFVDQFVTPEEAIEAIVQKQKINTMWTPCVSSESPGMVNFKKNQTIHDWYSSRVV